MRIISIRVFFSVVFLFIAHTACRNQTRPESSQVVAVRATKPEYRDMAQRLPYLGVIHAGTELRINAQIQGTVRELNMAEGASIKKGDVLIRLFAPELEAAVSRLRADRDYWQRRSAADRRLLKQNAIAPEQVEASERASATARAAYEEAYSRLQKSIEIAPFDGVLLKWYVEPGQHVMPGQPLLLLGDTSTEIHVNLVEEDLRNAVQVGTPVSVCTADSGRIRSLVSETAPLAQPASGTALVKIPYPEKKNTGSIFGTSVPVEFLVKENHRALAVPVRAVKNRYDDPQIFLIEDGRARKVSVRTGIEDQGWIAADFEWNGSELVAVSNLNDLTGNAEVFAVIVKEDNQ